jgi:uncharacterized protein YcnI
VRLRPAAAAIASTLVLSSSALAHVDPVGTIVATGRSTVNLTVHNDREEPQSAVRATLPSGLTVAEAPAPSGWEVSVSESSVTWEGTIEGGSDQTFQLDVEASTEPGPITIAVEQIYPGGEAASWQVPFTVVPTTEPTPTTDEGEEESAWRSIAIVGILIALAALAITWIRRGRVIAEQQAAEEQE